MARRPQNHSSRPSQEEQQTIEGEASLSEDRWLDLIADLIVEDLLNQESE